jgi:RNA polymerase-binding transcription factor DksA
MATQKKQAAKPTKNVKKASGAPKSAPARKVMTKAPSKKGALAKAAPKKNTVPVKAKAKPAAKKAATPAKKTPAKNTLQTKATAKKTTHKTVTKKTIQKPAPAAKKAAPAKKVQAKKAVEVKKSPVAKKAAPKKKEAPAKASAKQPAKAVPAKTAPAKAAPVAKKGTPARPATPIKGGIVKKGEPLKHLPSKLAIPVPKPTATPAARSLEKKPNIIIAHRRLENKSKGSKEAPAVTPYQPETYRSILDMPEQQHGPVYRYSDEELAEFKEIIASRLEAARKELSYLQGLITRKDEAGTEDTENRYMNMEDGSGAMEREQLAQLASRQIQFMGHLEKALVRIENKTYGICRVTGKLIDKARLRAVPHATLSIEAKKMMGAKQGQ